MQKVELPPVKTSYYMSNLTLNEEIVFEVSANTIIGEGEKTHSVSTAPQEKGTRKRCYLKIKVNVDLSQTCALSVQITHIWNQFFHNIIIILYYYILLLILIISYQYWSEILLAVAARIASFSAVMLIPWQHTLTLQCLAVGDPSPGIQWKIR